MVKVLLELGLTWTQTYFFIRILYIFLSILAVFLVLLKFWGDYKKVIIGLILSSFPIVLGLYYAPVFIDDFSSNPKDIPLNSDSNSVIIDLFKREPDFDGLFVIVNPECEHCLSLGPELNLLSSRNPSMDISVLVFTKRQKEIDDFKTITNLGDRIKFYPTRVAEDVFELNLGGFPCFFYVKEKRFVNRWQSEYFGFIAKDELESFYK